MKKGNRYFSPLTFNLLAVVWIIGLLPIAVAFVSNVGNDPNNDDYEQMSVDVIELKYGEGNSPLYGDDQLCNYAFNCTGFLFHGLKMVEPISLITTNMPTPMLN